MKKQTPIIFAILFLLSFTLATACVPKTDIKVASPEEPNIPNRNRSPEEIAQDAKDSQDRLDKMAGGGQPAKITLYGAIAKFARTDKSASFNVRTETGKSWRGTPVKLSEDRTASLIDAIPSDAIAAVAGSFEARALSFGCSDELVKKHLGTAGPNQIPKNDLFDETTKIVRAEKIVICGDRPLPVLAMISITAHELIIIEARMTYSSPGAVLIRASKLTVIGNNSLASIAPNGNVTLMTGPSIDVTVVDRLDIQGTLNISSVGSSYEIKLPEKK